MDRQFIETAECVEALDPDAITYSASISACEKAARWQQALDLLADARGCCWGLVRAG